MHGQCQASTAKHAPPTQFCTSWASGTWGDTPTTSAGRIRHQMPDYIASPRCAKDSPLTKLTSCLLECETASRGPRTNHRQTLHMRTECTTGGGAGRGGQAFRPTRPESSNWADPACSRRPAAQPLASHHRLTSSTAPPRVFTPIAVVGVHHKDQTIGALVVVAPEFA